METITITKEQAIAVSNAIWHYADDSGKTDSVIACQVLEQISEKFFA